MCRESWNNFSLHSLQFCCPAKVPYVHGTPPLAPTSFSATLAGHLLCGEPRDHSSTCLLKLSNPARAPSAWRALGSPGLHPLQPQLSCHSATCMERHRTSQPAHCLSSSCSAGEHRAPQDPSLYPLQFQLCCQCALFTQTPRTPWLVPTSALAVLPGCPLCLKPQDPYPPTTQPAPSSVLAFLPEHLLCGEPRYC